AVGDEDRVAGVRRVVQDLAPVWRPNNLHGTAQKETRASSHRRHEPCIAVSSLPRIPKGPKPHMGVIVGESDVAESFDQGLLKAALCEIEELATAHLAHPSVERSIAVGHERHELAIPRDGGVELRALPVREAAETGARERILPVVPR